MCSQNVVMKWEGGVEGGLLMVLLTSKRNKYDS